MVEVSTEIFKVLWVISKYKRRWFCYFCIGKSIGGFVINFPSYFKVSLTSNLLLFYNFQDEGDD